MSEEEIKQKAQKFVISNVSWSYWMDDINAQRLVYYFEQGYKARMIDEEIESKNTPSVLHGKLPE